MLFNKFNSNSKTNPYGFFKEPLKEDILSGYNLSVQKGPRSDSVAEVLRSQMPKFSHSSLKTLGR